MLALSSIILGFTKTFQIDHFETCTWTMRTPTFSTPIVLLLSAVALKMEVEVNGSHRDPSEQLKTDIFDGTQKETTKHTLRIAGSARSQNSIKQHAEESPIRCKVCGSGTSVSGRSLGDRTEETSRKKQGSGKCCFPFTRKVHGGSFKKECTGNTEEKASHSPKSPPVLPQQSFSDEKVFVNNSLPSQITPHRKQFQCLRTHPSVTRRIERSDLEKMFKPQRTSFKQEAVEQSALSSPRAYNHLQQLSGSEGHTSNTRNHHACIAAQGGSTGSVSSYPAPYLEELSSLLSRIDPCGNERTSIKLVAGEGPPSFPCVIKKKETTRARLCHHFPLELAKVIDAANTSPPRFATSDRQTRY